MDGDPKDVAADSEEPKVFRIAQIDTPGSSKMDRRKFVMATVAGVGAAAAATMLSGCDPEPDEEPAAEPVEPVEPAEPVEEEAPIAVEPEEPEEEESSDEDSDTIGIICTCDTEGCSCVGNCTCNSVSTPGGHYWYPS